MSTPETTLQGWSDEQIARARSWMSAWANAGPELERLRRQELRQIDTVHAISLLCGPADYRTGPRMARPTSGLIEQQRWFKKAAHRE